MLETSLHPSLISCIETDDLKQFTSQLGSSQDQNGKILNSLLAHAVRNNALTIIIHLTSLGASPLSDPTFKALFTSTSFPSVQHLITNGALDINTNLDRLGTLLILAVKRNNQEHVSFCLKHGANPNLGLYAHMWSALATGAKLGASMEIIEMLLDAGARIEESNALHTAAENGRIDAVRILLENGADIDAIGFEYCADEGQAEEAGNALHFAVDGGNSDVLKLLLEKGANASLKYAKGRTVKQRASEKGNEEVKQILHEFGSP